MHTSEQIKAEIEERFGFFPPFFEPALDSAQVLENLWQQTLSAYVENPFSALFKEKLNALLSRFCVAPYCMMVHSAALRPLGMTAGEVLALLDVPPPGKQGADPPLGILPTPPSDEAAAPAPDSALEKTLLFCATEMFLERDQTGTSQAEMRRLLGPDLYPHLVAYLAYIKTCHTWIEAHPGISHEADRRAIEHLGPLLADEPALAEFFRHYQERVAALQAGRVTEAAVAAERARAGQALRASEERLSLVLDNVKDIVFLLAVEPAGTYRFLFATPSFLAATGLRADQVIGRTAQEVIPPSAHALVFGNYAEAIRGRRAVEWLEISTYPSGERVGEVRVQPLFVEEGRCTHLLGTVHDITAPRQAEEALRRSREDLRLAIDAARLGTFYCDYPLDKIVWNATCKEHFFLTPDAEVDFALFYSLLHPDDREPTRRAIERAMAEHVEYDVEYRTMARDGRTRWVNAVGRFYYGPDGDPIRFDGITIDISARKTSEEELRGRIRRERFLAGLSERAQSLTDPDEVIADAVRSVGEFLGVSRCIFADIDIEADTCTVRPDYRADPSAASIEGVVPISAFGSFVVAEYAARRAVAVDDVRADPIKAPPETVAAYEAIGIRAHVTVPVVHSDRVVSCISVHNTAPRHWQPEETELLQAVVERTWLTVEVLRQQRALAREAEERREAHERTAAILGSITDAFISLDTEWRFTHINDQAESVVFQKRDEVIGRGFWDVFPGTVGTTFERQYRRAVNEGVTVSFEEFFPPLDTWFEVRAYPSTGGLSIFFQNVNARKKIEKERERLLTEQRARAEREALLNRIGQTLRGSSDPEAVQGAAVRLLGEALGADRCYFALYNLASGTVSVTHDWHITGLPSVEGVYPFTDTAGMFRELYQGSGTSVIPDTHTALLTDQTRTILEGLGLRSRVSVALMDPEGLTATLTAAMTDGAREWTDEEVTLMEAVATQLRIGVETARVQQREHKIAEQLQAALQPELPGAVPGLALVKHYEAALTDQAGVGGDFYDVFSLDKNCTALVVGDLSGKGLAAAAQVSIVRNMLRAFLYTRPRLGEAVTEMNRVLAENNLLTGFSTLFVGAYDGGTRILNYVNAGQEPALVRRGATGAVEHLPPTGPVLGTFENARFTEETIALARGDALAIFTDGVTEIGPRRTEMLGIEGVAALLSQPLAPGEAPNAAGAAERLARRLVAGVDAAAQGGVMRDDVCLLVAVVDGG